MICTNNGATPSSFYHATQTTKIPVDTVSAAAIDQPTTKKEIRQQLRHQRVKDKETIPNMHLVRYLPPKYQHENSTNSEPLRRRAQKQSIAKSVPRAERENTSKASSTNWKTSRRHQDLLSSCTPRQADE